MQDTSLFSVHRFSICPEGYYQVVEQSPDANLSTELNQEGAFSSGVVSFLLEDVRLQQEVPILRVEELGRSRGSRADTLSFE